ncbi:RIP metalloprotease RseP [uncultured Desulfuromonas sp.]|uniref:RIP metalloprotease RseP n=1 Tax=uncultured Desulfuromonas sp. TaxID=181013 RepID=UPI002AAC13FB|nr:RIP metalloprotease RseP [uncultured Desulfuromonas sp.]
MITVVAGILMLGVLVFIHELGHFCVAKLAGVKVLKFSLGFGPRIVSRTWGETEYLISLIPLGGYVQMLGEGVGEEEEPLTEEEKKRSFAEKTVSRRMAIVAAGPIMNLLLPLMLLPLAYMVGVNVPTFLNDPPCIGYVIETSDAAKAGFQAGDCIVSVNNHEVTTWTETDKALIPLVGARLQFSIDRQGQTVALDVPAENGSLEGLQSLGLMPMRDAVIGTVSAGMPAEEVGLQVGDRIVRIGDQPINSWYQLHNVIQQLAGEQTRFVVQRSGHQMEFVLAPKAQDGLWLIGITPQQMMEERKYGFFEAIEIGVQRTGELIDLTLVFIRKLVAGHVPADNIGGPIMVMQIAGQAAQTDFSTILTVLSFLSIQLGILNLLPIPVLDGGHLFFNLVEIVWRRPLSLRAREVMQQIGLGLLLMLMVLAFYNDIVRLFLQGSG